MSCAVRRSTICCAVLGLMTLADCGTSTGSSEGLRIKLVNSTGLNVRVVVDGPQFNPVTVDVASGAQQNVYPDGGQGDFITFQVTVPANGAITGSGACTAGPDMVPGSTGDVHGQVTLGLASATTISVECSGAGLPGGGWQ